MKRSLSKYWWVAFLVAWLVDFLFWRKPTGISFTIWMIFALGGMVGLAWSEGVSASRRGVLLAAMALIGTVVTFLRAEPMTRFVNGAMAVGFFLLLAATFKNGDWFFYRVVDYIIAAFWLVIAALSRLVQALSVKPPVEENAESRKKGVGNTLWPLLRGLLLAIPVLAVLGGLLASADPIFGDALKRMFNIEHLGEYIFRLAYILFLAYLLAGVYLHAVMPVREQQRPDRHKPWLPAFLGWTESTVVLVAVNLLFVGFVLVQFRYFFGGAANITETGYTYSEYARRGFGELVAVAVLSLLLYLTLAAITRQESSEQKRIFSILTVLLMGLVAVILVSAFQRLLLYEEAYGFTRMRTYPHVFMVWLGALLGAAILFEVIQRRGFFALALLFACTGYCLTLAAINVDGLIARHNIARAQNGAPFDTLYLRELSEDAVPVLLDAFDRKDLSAQLHNEIGGDLACRYALLERDAVPWQSTHLAVIQARQLLLARYADFSQYRISTDDYNTYVEVNGEQQICQYRGGFD